MHNLCIEHTAGYSRNAPERNEEGLAGLARISPRDVVVTEPGDFACIPLARYTKAQHEHEDQKRPGHLKFQSDSPEKPGSFGAVST